MPPMTQEENRIAPIAGDPKCVAQVVLNLPVDRAFDYSVPELLRDSIGRGKRVKVPFGPRVLTGYCIGTSASSSFNKLKPIIKVLDPEPILDESILELTRWMATYYRCSWGEALDAALPGGVKRESQAREKQFAALSVDPEQLEATLERLRNKSRATQAKVLELLADAGRALPVAQITKSVGCSASPIASLEKAGLIALERRRVTPDPFFQQVVEPTDPWALTVPQSKVLSAVNRLTEQNRFGVVLLLGVTGSGKTEVYLQAINSVVRAGKQAIVLVPEIALTPQAVRRFRERFDNVYVLHSMLSDTQRHSQWQAIREGKPGVVIGPRSAIFAPVANLGLLVIDEEHESTFKQQSTPRYHARDAGIMRAKGCNAPVLLGSATPSLESYANAKAGKFELHELTERAAGWPMPAVELVDMRNEFIEQKRQVVLSRRLIQELQGALARQEQAILFINRRGFSTHVQCRRCGYLLSCEYCSIALTYHRSGNFALCHYCGTSVGAPNNCPDCRAPDIKYSGAGTQRIEDLITQILPDARLLRMDSDTMRRRDAYEKSFQRFEAREVDILIGTQMIAKGLDFANVTVVGVIAADLALNLPDFRAAERTFQLLAQVAGRTGRGPKGGKVIVQTFNDQHYSITTAAQHNYAAFADIELPHRKTLGYAPYTRMARILLEGRLESAVEKAASALARNLSAGITQGARLLGPAPAPIERAEELHRHHLIIQTGSAAQLRALLDGASEVCKSTAQLRITVDVDPTHLL